MTKALRRTALASTPLLIFATLAPAAPAHGATGTTDTVTAAADSFVNSLYPAAVNGTKAELHAGTKSGGRQVSYLRFTVPSADLGRVISARLVLTRTLHHLPNTTVTVSSTAPAWSESTLTAATAPAVGTAIATQPVNSSMNSVSFDVTSIAGSAPSVDVAVTSAATNDVAAFNSREAATGAPALVLTLAPAPSTPPCTVSRLLVSSCQVWLGDAPQSHYVTPSTQTQRLSYDETFTGRRFDVLHQYQVNGTLFPNAETIALAQQGRLLAENWKPATDMTWAKVAAGGADARIDAEAAYLKANFTAPFFLAIYHEPEDNVVATPGSGMTVADYVAMFRHAVLRLRADGVTNAVTVMNYMGYYRWDYMRDALYPGDDVVDWIAWDPYMFAPSGAAGHDFAALVNTAHGSDLGFYDWATTNHPGKPLMLGEFGAYDNNIAANPDGQGQFFATIAPELPRFPALKALDYFTMNPADVPAGNGTQPTENAATLGAWQQFVRTPTLNGPAISYVNGSIVTN